MRLTSALTDAPAADLAAGVHAILDARLRRNTARPLAVALSGGGDSLALALIAADWARRAGRRLLVLTVDHRLQAQSGDWTRACAAIAGRLGADFHPLAWDGPKPAAGLPAAARHARHALLADAARDAGARVILMGHTADDRLEAQAMRDAGATTPDPGEWSPSPAWPQGRGRFLLRPMLGLRRAALRDWLGARGEAWIDDPANTAESSLRARTRLAGVEGTAAPAASALALAGRCIPLPGGGLGISRDDLRTGRPQEVRRLLALATVCVGGGARRPATTSLERMASALAGDGAAVAILAGTRIEADGEDIRFLREAGEARRGGLAALSLAAGQAGVWDGRFEITGDRPVTVRALAGLARRLPDHQRRRLAALPATARGGLPAILEGDAVSCPVLSPSPGITVRDLVHDRLMAAAGLADREPA